MLASASAATDSTVTSAQPSRVPSSRSINANTSWRSRLASTGIAPIRSEVVSSDSGAPAADRSEPFDEQNRRVFGQLGSLAATKGEATESRTDSTRVLHRQLVTGQRLGQTFQSDRSVDSVWHR